MLVFSVRGQKSLKIEGKQVMKSGSDQQLLPAAVKQKKNGTQRIHRQKNSHEKCLITGMDKNHPLNDLCNQESVVQKETRS